MAPASTLRPAPPSVFGDAHDPRISVGLAQRGGGWHLAGPTLSDLTSGLHITGIGGSGKTRLVANVACQLIPMGFVAFDGRGDEEAGNLTGAVRQLIPLVDEPRLVLIDPRDTDWPVGISPLAGAAGAAAERDLRIAQALTVLASLDPETWARSPVMREEARLAVQLVLEAEPRPTLAHVRAALADWSYRAALLAACPNAELAAYWLRAGDEPTSRASRDALLRRLSLLLAGEATRPLFADPAPVFSFARAVAQRSIVLVSLPRVTYGPLATAIGLALVQAFAHGVRAQGRADGRAAYGCLFDDLELLTPPGLPADELRQLIGQLRAFGVATVYAHHSLRQVGDLAEALLVNAGSRVVLRALPQDAAAYARQYASSAVTPGDYAGQDPAQHQYAALRCAGAPTSVFSLRPLAWPEPVAAAAGPARGLEWRQVLPAGNGHPADGLLLRAAYGPEEERERVVRQLVCLDDAAWADARDRWAAISAAQRAAIIANPGCVPDRFERQRWLSRLHAATPRALAEAAYARLVPGKEGCSAG